MPLALPLALTPAASAIHLCTRIAALERNHFQRIQELMLVEMEGNHDQHIQKPMRVFLTHQHQHHLFSILCSRPCVNVYWLLTLVAIRTTLMLIGVSREVRIRTTLK